MSQIVFILSVIIIVIVIIIIIIMITIIITGLKIKKIPRSPFGNQLAKNSHQMPIFSGQFQAVKMRRQPALLPATLRFSPAVNCWRKAKNSGLKKSCQVENRIEKEFVFIIP